MKIIGWNCNGAFRKKYDEIMVSKPDILIVSECENPQRLKMENLNPQPKDFKWFGDNPNKGIGIFSFTDYFFELLHEYNPNFKLVVPLKIRWREFSFLLMCVWTKENKYDKNSSYIGQVWNAMRYYSNLISKYDTIIMGDFNSNKIWDHKRPITNHTQVVNILKNYRIESLYHKNFLESQGEESRPTFFLHKKESKAYHIDYCFASQNIYKKKFKVNIGKFKEWIKTSDHVPITIELEWKPQQNQISNSLLESIESKFKFFGHNPINEIYQIGENILQAVSKIEEMDYPENERLSVIENVENYIKALTLISKIKENNFK